MKITKFPIDLSMLTEEEIDQFRQDPSTLFEGDTDVCLYLRFSSERQREQSIEGQLRDCRTFCKLNSYRITAIYVDRATTARKDVEKRVHFQEMIRDSEKKPWEYVVVWKLDRFARNRTDSALFKFRLRKNGVKVISATENISEKPEGIILEAVLEGMAEFYSADLSQKITRGMRESALKCHSIGGHVPLGYKIEDHKLVINPATAHIVQEAFELYANGETVADICRMFNAKGYRTAKGVEFNRNSFKSMFRNKRYIGVYTYKDIEVEDGVPAIIDKELFETVGRRLSKNAEAPARGKAKVDYLLAGKLFCGHCGGSMNGESGTSKTGAIYNYYTCYTRKRKHACDKKPLKKDWIEYIVAQDAMELLTDDTIQEMADMAISQTEQDLRENTRIPELTERMKETESGIANITKAIEKGVASDALMNRLMELEKEKKNLLRLLAEEEKYVCKIERSQIVYWLTEFKGGRIEDERYRRIIIDLMVNSVTVWDEPDGFRITTAYNLTSCKSKTFRIDPSGTKGFGFEGLESTNFRKITADSAVIFCLTTELPQTNSCFDHGFGCGGIWTACFIALPSVPSFPLSLDMSLQRNHFRLGRKGINGCRTMLEIKHGHQVIIHRVHTAQGGGVGVHHGDACLPAGVLLDFALYANPGAFMHPADLHLAIGLHLLVYLLLVVGDDVQLAFKFTDGAKGAHMGLTVLIGGQIEGAAGLQIFSCLVHRENSFQSSGCVFFVCKYNYMS